MITIPKIIMQTWKTTDLPNKCKLSQLSIQKYMPTWRYILMTDKMNRSFISEYFPTFISYFDNFTHVIQKVNAIRYAWLYIFGGIYLDCDFELLSPLDGLFTENHDLFLLPKSNNSNILTSSLIACKPGNKIWLEFIEEMKKPSNLLEKHLSFTTSSSLNRIIKRTNVSYKLLSISNTVCDLTHNTCNSLMKPLESTTSLYEKYISENNYSMIYCVIIVIIISLSIIAIIYRS